jgi:hypothetical protein
VDDAGDAGDAGDADGVDEIRVDAFHDDHLEMVSASGRAAAVAAAAVETVVEAPARGAQLSPVRERCSSWRADGAYEKRVDGFRDARLKLVSASEMAAAVAAAAAETVVKAPARGAQLRPVRERCSTSSFLVASWRQKSPILGIFFDACKARAPTQQQVAIRSFDGPS